MPRTLSLKVIVFVIVLWMVEVACAPLFPPGPRPLLLYLAVLYAGMQWHWSKVFSMALAVGLLRDLTGSQALGIETTVLLATAPVLALFIQKIERAFLLMRMGMAFFYTLAVSLLVLMVTALLGLPVPAFWAGFGAAFGAAFWTAVFLPVVFFIASRWFHDQMYLKQYELF